MAPKEINEEILALLTQRLFFQFEQLGIHITENHYYSPIPDTREFNKATWERETKLKGINLNEELQLRFLNSVCSKYKEEYDSFGLHKPEANCKYYVYNGMFGEIDGDILYCMIRHFKPKKIIEIGSGWSTHLSAYALRKNQLEFAVNSELIAIEPFPSEILREEVPELSKLIESKVQDVNIDFFKSLEDNDILFIDSSHVAKIDSDVCYEFLEIFPRLKKGVIIHIHDIFLPRNYPKDWVLNQKRFWNEAFLLQAFLMFNEAFEVLWAGHYMSLKYPHELNQYFRSNASQSFWIRKVK